jgi:anti-sigma regulatory factor (Ser/Thr protein kinase)
MKRTEQSPSARVIPMITDGDIVEARMATRALAADVGFTGTDLVMIATAVSEVARNIIEYAKQGEVVLSVVLNNSRRGVEVVARDQGPGIADIEQAMREGFSTSRGLGLGLPGSRRLMDEFRIESQLGRGTTITMRKWLP